MTRAEITDEARRWIGVPYVPRGRSATGLDCLGLLFMLGRAFRIPHTDIQDYTNWPARDLRIIREFREHLVFVPPTTKQDKWPGLIGIFAERRLPCHTGVFSLKHDRLHLIHARIRPPYVIEECWDQVPRHELRMICLFALPGMED